MLLHIDQRTWTHRRGMLWAVLVAAGLFLVLAGCVPIQPPPTTEIDRAPEATPAPLDDLDLANATYQGIYEEPIQLQGGVYEGEPFSAESAIRPRVVLSTLRADGDIDGDGDLDSAVLLSENSGGTGTFIYLAAVLNDNGTPVNAATTLLGDRVRIERFIVLNGEITLDLIVHGATDPMCCPSKPINQTWAFNGAALILTSGVSASDAAMNVSNPVQFGSITFNHAPSLAQDWHIEEIGDNRPAEPAPPDFSVGPARIVFTAEGYPNTGATPISPTIYIYRTDDLADSPEGDAAAQLTDLLRAQPDPATVDELPFLPRMGASQVLHSHAAYTGFDNGDGLGLRYITYYAQDVAPLQGSRFWYTFQGLTNDGSVYVAAVFPVMTHLFDDTLPEDFDADAFAANLDAYMTGSLTILNGALPTDFSPNFSLLDALMRSLVIDNMTE